MMFHRCCFPLRVCVLPLAGAGLLGALLTAAPALAQAETVLDLASVQDGDRVLQRIHGADGTGTFGLPVTTGFDVDGDGRPDSAVAFMTASPLGRFRGGEVDLVFGRGFLDGTLETAFDDPAFLRFYGAQTQENAGSEIWIDDVTGDGLADLLICRQNYTASGGRIAAGALTIVSGGAHLRTFADDLEAIDLASPPVAPVKLEYTTIHGRDYGDRFCIWLRTGDVDGDGTADIVVGADQEDRGAETHVGAVWVLRGGSHLDDRGTLDLADFGTMADPLDGDIAHVLPPASAIEYHAGATCAIADLDDDGKGEVLFAATLNRAGAALQPLGASTNHSSGGPTDGRLYIAWDDHFPTTPWATGYELTVTSSANYTIISGEPANVRFGEEIVGGLDLDGDGDLELVIGDLQGNGGNGTNSGLGHVFFDAQDLQGLDFGVAAPPLGVVISRVAGPEPGAIGADTAALADVDGDGLGEALADVDGDGLGDLLFTSPHASPYGRFQAGQAHVIFGKNGAWPALVDLGNLPPAATIRTAEINGAVAGDVLAYSAAAGDIDGDGYADLAINEMVGDAPTAMNVGNLLLITGRTFDPAVVFFDSFESGDIDAWTSSTF